MKNLLSVVAILILSSVTMVCAIESPASAVEANATTRPVTYEIRVEAEAPTNDFCYGMPIVTDTWYNYPDRDEPSISVLYRGFGTILYAEGLKQPLCVGVELTRAEVDASSTLRSRKRNYDPDPDIQEDARASPKYDFKNSGMTRGHLMPRSYVDDWDRCKGIDYTSNLIPQTEALNGGAWNSLERAIPGKLKEGKIDRVWIFAGPAFDRQKVLERLPNGVAIPDWCYKIVAWEVDGKLLARGYLYPQYGATERDPASYLCSIDEIERLVGIDFFPELANDVEVRLEAAEPKKMW